VEGGLTDKAYAAVKSRVLSGDIAPNTHIDEKQLAAQLGMSRTPVREALLRLQHEGLVTIARGKGIQVLSLSSVEMRGLYQAITAMEVMAVYILAERRPDAETLAPLTDALARLEAASQQQDLDAWGQADEAFHRALLQICGNRYLKEAGLGFRDRAQRAHMVAMRLQPPQYLARSYEAHAGLVDLIRSGDAQRASDAHLDQRRRGENALVSAVERFRLQVL
jgi:DNA-binding GntR family transcriptional regulator